MNISSIVGVALVCASLVVLIRKYASEFAVPMSVIASMIILIISIVFASSLFDKIEEIADNSSISSQNLKVIFKALGVCYITQIGKDVCKDCGESAIADKVDLAGKITIAAMSLSLVSEVLSIILEIIGL